jgi:hypothetical protein
LRHGKKAKVAQRGNYGILQPRGAAHVSTLNLGIRIKCYVVIKPLRNALDFCVLPFGTRTKARVQRVSKNKSERLFANDNNVKN